MTAYYTLNDGFTANDASFYQEVQQYFLTMDWAGSKWRPVHKVQEKL